MKVYFVLRVVMHHLYNKPISHQGNPELPINHGIWWIDAKVKINCLKLKIDISFPTYFVIEYIKSFTKLIITKQWHIKTWKEVFINEVHNFHDEWGKRYTYYWKTGKTKEGCLRMLRLQIFFLFCKNITCSVICKEIKI